MREEHLRDKYHRFKHSLPASPPDPEEEDDSPEHSASSNGVAENSPVPMRSDYTHPLPSPAEDDVSNGPGGQQQN
jgi:hypothetical protein